MTNIEKGKKGEDFVNITLKNYGYEILCRNFRCCMGEIDIIYKRQNFIVFGEIKTRYSNKFGIPCEAVNFKKQQKIRKTALFYIQKNRIRNKFLTFDVIEVLFDSIKSNYTINIIEDAF